MRFILLTLGITCITTSGWGLNDLGTLSDAKKTHPAIFIPGNVLKYTVSGAKGYVYNGESEKCFSGDIAEKDSELYQEAVLDAKRNLIAFLRKQNPNAEVTISGAEKLYEYPEENMRRVVCFVEEDMVSINERSIQRTIKASEERKVSVINTNEPIRKVVKELEREPIKKEPVKENSQHSMVSGDKSPLESCLMEIAKNPSDCTFRSRAAKLYIRQGDLVKASRMYADIVSQVISNERIDKEFGAELLMEAAKFERYYGDINTALKYYRLLVRCDGLRRWRLDEKVSEANKNIADILLSL